MKLFTIFGNPVSHSISPRMHNLALQALHVEGVYTRYLLQNGKDLKKTFYNLKLSGANVTIPYKEDAFSQCDFVKGIAKEIKAVNTLVNKNGKLYGYNTDAHGFILSIKDFFPLRTALIIGAGGTAKAISSALKEVNVKVSIVNRSLKRLDDFKNFDSYHWENFTPKQFDIIINTTSAGLNDSNLPLLENLLIPTIKKSKYAFDVIYHKKTPFMLTCKENNLTCKDGKDMLLYQGVLAFNLFFNGEFNEDIIKQNMEKAFIL